MAVKLIALYTQPSDPQTFDQQYFETHIPLAEKMPGLKKMDVVKIQKNMMGGERPYYMIAELFFDNMEALNAAMSSPEGQAAGANLMSFAAKNVTLLTAEVCGQEAAAHC